ncbi:uncharacterized protein LOC121866310 [Homarus americanus]|uniref:uncharacterized protein LOC121866310 n=1 Tax=Homarus americanus TaxID=6706 RepID=UPI001C440025|nr:uncharacterized protein LOC121866310 [Homarus americanus]
MFKGICVGGLWSCGGVREDSQRPDAIIQLRRDVAATLVRLAIDLRAGHTMSVASELEATAALLDARHSSKVRGPPPPRPGFTPAPLGIFSSNSTPLNTVIGNEEIESGKRPVYAMHARLTDGFEKFYNHSLRKFGLIDKSNKTAYLSKNTRNLIKNSTYLRRINRKKSEKAESHKTTRPPEKQEQYGSKYPYYNGEEDPRQSSKLDYSESIKSVYPVYPSDVINSFLPGIAQLDDLGDDPLPPLSTQVTVLLDGCSSSPPYIVSVVRQARALWRNVGIIVGVDDEKRAEVDDISHLADVTFVTVRCEKWRRSNLHSLIASVTTPYVLVLDGVIAITDDLDLNRLLSVALGLRSLGVGIVSGAERGRDGSWDYMCTRLTMSNSRLTLRDGYEYSRAACIFCDVAASSFLAATRIIRDVPYDQNMPHKSLAIDWSLRVQRQGYLTMTCPDVMFHVQRIVKPKEQHREPDRSCVTKEERKQARAQLWAIKRQYRKLAQKWELNYITFSNGTSFEYNCREVHYDCSASYKVRYYILPPCCLKIKNKMLNTVNIIAKENHVPYEISSGTLLGAVKFKDGLPWDFDDDAYYRNSDVEVFIRNKQRMRRLGLSPYLSDQPNKNNKSVISKYIYATSQGGFALDLWGRNSMPSLGTLEALGKYPDNLVCLQHGHIATSIKVAKSIQKNLTLNRSGKKMPPSCYLSSFLRVGTNWLPGPWNPGKKALAHYGDNMYRHEAHWRWNDVENPGWKPCPRPGHHTCLDLHPLDGSLPFL